MKKILIIDDDKDLRFTISSVLETGGFLPVEAASGQRAIMAVLQAVPDAVVLDLKMPGMDGIATLKELKRIAPLLPVIILTAFGDIDIAVAAMKIGADDFITKPPNYEDLIIVIKNLTRLSDQCILSSREVEILEWVKAGKSNSEIATVTQISENTVHTHLRKIFIKLDVGSRAQAVAVAIEKRILPVRSHHPFG